MDFIENVKKAFTGSSSDDYDEYDDDYDYDDEDDAEEAPKGGFFKSKKAAPVEEPSNDYDDEEEEVEEAPAPKKLFGGAKKAAEPKTKKTTSRKGGRGMAIRQTEKITAEVTVKIPRTEDDTTEIVELLLQGNAVLINVEGIGPDQAQRVVDYVSGACYAIDGKFQKVSHNLFVACPKDVALSGDFIEDLSAGFPLPSFDING